MVIYPMIRVRLNCPTHGISAKSSDILFDPFHSLVTVIQVIDHAVGLSTRSGRLQTGRSGGISVVCCGLVRDILRRGESQVTDGWSKSRLEQVKFVLKGQLTASGEWDPSEQVDIVDELCDPDDFERLSTRRDFHHESIR